MRLLDIYGSSEISMKNIAKKKLAIILGNRISYINCPMDPIFN